MNNIVYLVPPDTEVPAVLELEEIEDENRFLKIAACDGATDAKHYICVTDGDIDFMSKYKLELPFTPTLLTKIPGVTYSRFFLLAQTTFDTVTYDAIEAEKGVQKRETETTNAQIEQQLQARSQFKPPRKPAMKIPKTTEESDTTFDIEEG